MAEKPSNSNQRSNESSAKQTDGTGAIKMGHSPPTTPVVVRQNPPPSSVQKPPSAEKK